MAAREFWKGRAAELLTELTAGWNGDIPDKWPKAGNKLSNRLRRVMPQLAAVGIRVMIGKTSDRSHHAVIAIEKNGPGGDDGLRTIQVAPPLSSETLRSSKVAQSQEESSSCGSEHRRISEDTGGGIEIDLEKKGVRSAPNAARRATSNRPTTGPKRHCCTETANMHGSQPVTT
jgi:hypothetical protein